MKKTALIFAIVAMHIGLSACSNTATKTVSWATSPDKSKAEAADSNLDEAQKEAKRQSLLKMANDTLNELYAKDSTIKDKVEKAYAYAVFDDYIYNAVFYVAGKGSGVGFKKTTKEPIYLLMLRAGTGPGIGYTKFRQLLIIKNEATFKEISSVGLDVQASTNATFKVSDFGSSKLYAGYINPYVDVYTITDAGVDIQANWGGVEFIKDWGLNKDTKTDSELSDKAGQ